MSHTGFRARTVRAPPPRASHGRVSSSKSPLRASLARLNPRQIAAKTNDIGDSVGSGSGIEAGAVTRQVDGDAQERTMNDNDEDDDDEDDDNNNDNNDNNSALVVPGG